MTAQTVLVTGGGRGIGRAVALGLAADGMRVAICARSPEQLDETVRASGGVVVAIPADVSNPEQVESMIHDVEHRLGPVGLLINNAGVGGPFAPLWECDADEMNGGTALRSTFAGPSCAAGMCCPA